MTLLRFFLGWVAVVAWYLLFELMEQRLIGARPEGRLLRARWTTYAADALLLTLLAGLWFASLGHGGWILLFLLIGLLMEGPARSRGKPGGVEWNRPRIIRIGCGVFRVVVAGGLLAWRL
jgi:hypothetical protein